MYLFPALPYDVLKLICTCATRPGFVNKYQFDATFQDSLHKQCNKPNGWYYVYQCAECGTFHYVDPRETDATPYSVSKVIVAAYNKNKSTPYADEYKNEISRMKDYYCDECA